VIQDAVDIKKNRSIEKFLWIGNPKISQSESYFEVNSLFLELPPNLLYKSGKKSDTNDISENLSASLKDNNQSVNAETFLSGEDKTFSSLDVIINAGASACVMDQKKFFKNMHDFTAKDGFMIHLLPFFGLMDKVFYGYEYEFFEGLAQTNGYEIVMSHIQIGEDIFPFKLKIMDSLDFSKVNKESVYWFFVVLQKKYSFPFAIPFQEGYKPIRRNRLAHRYKIVRNGDFVEDSRNFAEPSNRYRMAQSEHLEEQRFINAHFPPAAAHLPSPSDPIERGVVIDFKNIIYGTGWGPCWYDENLQHYRFLGKDGRAVLYLRLDESLDYGLKLVVWCSPDPETEKTIAVKANGESLKKKKSGFEDGRYYVVFELPKEILSANPDYTEITFSANLPEPKESYAFKEISCAPI
jgi:hypothetical protein